MMGVGGGRLSDDDERARWRSFPRTLPLLTLLRQVEEGERRSSTQTMAEGRRHSAPSAPMTAVAATVADPADRDQEKWERGRRQADRELELPAQLDRSIRREGGGDWGRCGGRGSEGRKGGGRSEGGERRAR